jgi:hypothetical protein
MNDVALPLFLVGCIPRRQFRAPEVAVMEWWFAICAAFSCAANSATLLLALEPIVQAKRQPKKTFPVRPWPT